MGADLLAGELVVDDHDDGIRELIDTGVEGQTTAEKQRNEMISRKASFGFRMAGSGLIEVGRLVVLPALGLAWAVWLGG